MKNNAAIIFNNSPQTGSVSVTSGGITVQETTFNAQVRVEFCAETEDPKALVRVTTDKVDFTFFLCDINDSFPIIVKEYGVAVVNSDDARNYQDIFTSVISKGGKTKIQKYEAEPEESFETAAENTRDMKASTWLGIGNDIRIFELGFRGEDMSSNFSAPQRLQVMWDYIVPRYHADVVKPPALGEQTVQYRYMMGKGIGCSQLLSRRLEKNYLPILHADVNDEDIVYHATYFASNEKSVLKKENIKGTHYLVADGHSYAHTHTESQQCLFNSLEYNELHQDEETVLFMEVLAENISDSPKYCFMRLPAPNLGQMPERYSHLMSYDNKKGFALYADGTVYMTATLNGKPCPNVENSILLMPGETARFIITIPHYPISESRACALIERSYDRVLEECISYWENKLATPAEIILPEKRIEDMLKAGLGHIELMLYGHEPDGPLAPVVGMYCPIGSESTQIIDYLDSVGETELAERAIMFFFEKQHRNGFMQNYMGYMLETGGVLSLLFKHYKVTGNRELLVKLKDKVKKACDYMIAWRNDNKKEELRHSGYGMVSGQVADPEDAFHSFMLNGYAAAGLKHAAELLRICGDAYAETVRVEAEGMKEDIRTAVSESLAASPLVPYGDGFWRPSIAPWAEYKGPLCLHADGGTCTTHGTLVARDSLLGAMWLFPLDIIDPQEEMGEFILHLSTEHFHMRNVGYSQPYYCAHPFAHIKRGEVRSYLKELYNGVAGLADRETFTFWEHFFHDSAHKLAEEAMFMQRVRHLLFTEDGHTLSLLSMAPRKWFDGGEIKLKNVRSLLGILNLEISVSEDKKSYFVNLEITPVTDSPEVVKIRLPHPEGKKISSLSGIDAEIDGETLILHDFCGSQNFTVNFI